MTEIHRHAKKSETLEFRLPYEEKARFLAKVHTTGHSASDVLRQLIAEYPVVPATPELYQQGKVYYKKRLIAGALAIVFALVTVPVLAGQTLFAAFDLDGNGRIVAGEISAEGDADIIAALDTNKNGWLSLLELKPTGRGETFKEITDNFHNGPPKRWLEYSFVTFELKRDRNVVQDIKTGKIQIPFDATEDHILRIKSSIRVQMTKL